MRMSFKGYGFVLFFFLAIVLLPGAYAPDYETFLRQHFDNPKSNVGNRYCDRMMQSRGMTKPVCKNKNSFIHTTKKNINRVCDNSGGAPYLDVFRRSLTQYSVTTCNLQGSSARPPCNYRGNTSQRYIVVRCQGGNPVHFDEGLI